METKIEKMDFKTKLVTGFNEFKKSLDSEYVDKARIEAMEVFNTLGFPARKDEEYRYTNIFPITNKNFEISLNKEIGQDDINKFLIKGLDSNLVVIVNGHYNKALSKIKSSEEEIFVSDINESLNKESVKNNFLKVADYRNDSFIALNTAYFTGGVFIEIKKELKLPITILNICGSPEIEVMSQSRIFIYANKKSSADIIEISETINDNYAFSNTVVEIVADEDSNISHLKIQNDGEKSYSFTHTSVIQKTSSVYDSYLASWGGNIIRNNLTSSLVGKHSECILRGIYFIDGKRLIDNHTKVEHTVPECHSNELYKGIITDEGWGVFNGKIIVDKNAQKTNAYQSNKNILLSDKAVINAKPQLEIYADDVKCSHGATTGQLNQEELFYLRSRGISMEEAKKLLLYAFLDGVLTEYKVGVVRDYLEEKLHEKLEDA